MKEKIKNWSDKYKLHLLIWALFIFYETVVIGLVFSIFGHPLTYLTHYIAIFFLFYLHAGLFLPWSLKERRASFWKLPLVLIVEITGYILVSFLIDKLLIEGGVMPSSKNFELSYVYSLRMLYRGVYFLGFSTGYYFLVTYNKEKKKTNELEKQHLKYIIHRQKAEQELTKAQNAFLKAQINPHLLFNTLDFIYHNIDASSSVAADAIIVLSDMMRYAVDSDRMGDFIRLGDEIEQAENLIYLSQMRKDHALGFTLKYEQEVREINFIPLVLLTLIENVFKHANLNEPGHEPLIHIYIEKQVFHMITDNLIKYQPPKSGHHMGLTNIEKRLKYAYGEEVLFRYHTDEARHFILHLSIPIERLTVHGGSSSPLPDNDKGRLHDAVDQK
jgi:two-component system LytT family sensor kinase